MSDNYQLFLETLDTNSAKFASYYSAIGDYDYKNYTLEQIQEIILSLKPSTPRTITTICYIMSLYAKYLGCDNTVVVIKEINRSEIWSKAKPNAPQKFISNSKYKEVCHEILMYEEYNSFYKNVLFRAIYEGIYNEDMSVVKNLRASDIHGNIVTLRDDNGNVREMEISADLARDLVELSTVDTMERKNKYSAFSIPISGEYHDNCFKCETRPLRTKSNYTIQFRNIYHRLFRNIVKEYVEYLLPPSQLYVSGIMYRVCKKIKEAGYDVRVSFESRNKSTEISLIIANELARSGYSASVVNFKELIRGHREIFFEDGVI